MAAPFLQDWPELVAARTPLAKRLPVCVSLPGIERFAAPATMALTRALAAASDALEWRQTYSVDDFGPAFLNNYGWTELIGTRGPIPSATIACGFLLLAPGTDYPLHAHEAAEVYLPLAGAALWRRGTESFAARQPGDLIEHAPWTPHAMRTEDDPLLALYVWRGGDLAAKSAIIGRE
jgi:mannose-6-phosphate isomerase-like protein (cupin superfamily)